MNPKVTKALGYLLLVFSSAHAFAEDVGMSGLLDITGSMHHSPCVLDMTSAYQTVDLGNVPRSQLLRPGDQANPVAFQLRFQDCRRASGSLIDERTGTLVWTAYQPIVSVSFLAPADPDDPRLVSVRGVTGLGLRLTDADGRDVRLGSQGHPLFVAHGSDTLIWHVQPTRTSAPLTNGQFWAVMDFRLDYE